MTIKKITLPVLAVIFLAFLCAIPAVAFQKQNAAAPGEVLDVQDEETTPIFLSGTFAIVAVPPFFAAAVGPDVTFRFAVALVGGILAGLGARWAGGCTSGHGISGTLQLALSSWVAAACFFIGGIVVAGLLFGFRFP